MTSAERDQQHQIDDNGQADANDNHAPKPPKPTPSEVLSCQFSSWYSAFRNMDASSIRPNNITNKRARRNVTIESVIVRPLPEEFIEYLLSDGVTLPECANRVSSCMNDNNNNNNNNDDDGNDRWDSSSDDDEEEEDNDDDSNNEQLKSYNFPHLTQQIQTALTALGGGGCMPKLNWSAPKDAAWINMGSLKCTKAGDVYLLLKSSDFVGFDLEKAWEDLDLTAADDDNDVSNGDGGGGVGGAVGDEMNNLSITKAAHSTTDETKLSAINGANDARPPGFEYELVLRKWCNLHPSMEFRCFVYRHELVAISQRHPSKYYPHLEPPSNGSIHPSTIIIHAFFHTYIQNKFAQGKSHRYVIDLYLDSQERVWIVDFNVWGDRTDALLFDWKELMELGSQVVVSDGDDKQAADAAAAVDGDSNDDETETIPMMPELRVITKDMKSMTYDPLSSYRGPTDVMDLVGEGGGGASADFKEFMKQCVRPSEV